jgi:hypothetical protein
MWTPEGSVRFFGALSGIFRMTGKIKNPRMTEKIILSE